MARRMTRRQLEKLTESFEPSIRRAFLEAFRDVREQAGINAVADLIRAGRVDVLTEALGINSARFAPLTEAVRAVYAEGGRLAALEIPPLVSGSTVLEGPWRAQQPMRVHFSFDIRATQAEAWLREHSAKLVTEIVQGQQAAIRTTVAEGMALGRGPRQTALDIVGRVGETGRRSGGVVGLTQQQSQFVANARRELTELDRNYFTRERRDRRFDAQVRRAIESGKPLTAEQIDRITGRYADRLLQLRGETIARTESHESMNAARFESYRQAIEAGDLDPANVRKGWQATMDRRTRDSHEQMNGVVVPFLEPFVTPLGSVMMFAGDTSQGASAADIVNCRCPTVYTIDYAAEANRGR